MVTSHPTQLQLELAHAGEPVSAAVAAHLISCPQCSQFLRALERERELLLASEPPAQFASRMKQAAVRQAPERWWTLRKLRMGLGSSVAMAGTLAMAAVVAGRMAHWKEASHSGFEQAGRATTAARQMSNAARQVSTGAVGAPDGMEGAVSRPPPPASTGPKQLSMQAGNRLLAINPSLRPYRVHVPEEFTGRMGTGDKISPVLEICVTAQGSVKSVTIVTASIAVVDAQIRTVIPRWKYRPYLVDGKPEPFCYLTRYSIEAK
jgi:hypothetical protein